MGSATRAWARGDRRRARCRVPGRRTSPANAAWPAWRAKTAKERAACLRKWHDLMMTNQEDLAVLMTVFLVLGLRSRSGMQIDLNPKVDIPYVTVTTAYPGVVATQIRYRGYNAAGPYPINVFQANPFGAGSAMRILTDPADCGPVTLALCQDTQAEAYDYPEAFFEEHVWGQRRIEPDRDERPVGGGDERAALERGFEREVLRHAVRSSSLPFAVSSCRRCLHSITLPPSLAPDRLPRSGGASRGRSAGGASRSPTASSSMSATIPRPLAAMPWSRCARPSAPR